MTAEVLAVTGGAGFLGAEVVRSGVARGREVHVLARAATDRSSLAGLDVRWHRADVEDEAAVRRAFEEASRGRPLDVIHLAARISYRRADRELLRRVNVLGTRNVLAAARATGAARLCHVSSVVALGAARGPADELDDDAPLGGLRLDSAYARTKAESEELVRSAADELDVVVASPAVVFGAGAGANSSHFLERVRRGIVGAFSPPGSLSVVGLADASEGVLRVLERGARGRRYLLVESAWSLHELLSLACRLAGKRGPRVRLAPIAWNALVAAASVLDRVVASERATPEALALLGLHFRFRARRARAELSWEPRPFAEVLAEILAATEAP